MRKKKLHPKLPRCTDLIKPTFRALVQLGGSGKNNEILNQIIRLPRKLEKCQIAQDILCLTKREGRGCFGSFRGSLKYKSKSPAIMQGTRFNVRNEKILTFREIRITPHPSSGVQT